MGGKTTSTSATKLNQISIQSSSLGLPLAIGWGRGRITRPNLIWYGGFRAISHTTKTSGGKGLGGGSSNTTYTYTASIMMALCEGGASGIRGVVTVYRDSSVLAGIGAAGMSLAVGTPTQPVWGYLASMFPSQALAYSGIAYTYAQDYPLSDSATLPNHSYEVDFAEQMGGGIVDADPKNIVTDFLTDIAYGVPGWSSGLIADLSDWSLYCRASGLLLSPVLESQATASSILSEWLLATNSFAVWSEGVLKIASYGDTAVTGNGVTWTPDLSPEYDLDEDDMIPDGDGCPVQQAINDQSDAYNIVQIEYLDRANAYNTAIAAAQDLANIIEFGARKQDPTTAHCICDAGVAQHAAQLYLQRTLYVREGYTNKLPWNFVLLEPGDLVTLTTITDELQLSRELVRVTEIEEDEDGILSFTYEGLDIGTASAALYSSHSAAGYQANTNVSPGSVAAPVLFEAPSELTGFDPEIWVAVASLSSTWGGCNVWISGDGSSYRQIGTINEAARYGVTTADLPVHSDPDNSSTLAIDLSASLGVITGGTAAEMNAGATLALVDAEVVAYENATLTSASHYSLSPLRRGLHSTTIADHPAGHSFVRLDDAVFKFGFKDLNIGEAVYLKFTSFNLWGNATEDLSAVTAYTMTVSAASARYSQLTPDGPWDSGSFYEKGDIVSYNGSSYAALAYVSAGTLPTNAAYWMLLVAAGIPGAPGANGSSTYVHVAYSNSADGSADFVTGVANPGRTYIGIYTDSNSAGSGDYHAYYWSRLTGADGTDGSNGVPGMPGANGQTPYVHFAYADASDGSSGFSFSPGTHKYVGIYTDFTSASSGSYTAYAWSLIKGADGATGGIGAPGANGTNGVDGLAALNIHTVGAVSWDGHNLLCPTRCGNWNTNGAYSSNVIPGGVSLTFQRPNNYDSAAEDAFVGISQSPTASLDYPAVEFAWRMGLNADFGSTTYNAEIWHAGAQLFHEGWNGSYTYSIRYDTNTGYVTWYHIAPDGTTTAVYSYNVGTGKSFGFEATAAGSMSLTNVAFTAAGGTGATGAAGTPGPPGAPGSNGSNGVSPAPKYTASTVGGEGTWNYSAPVPLENGQTVTFESYIANAFSSTHAGSATITVQSQASLDNSSWSVMTSGSLAQSVAPNSDLVEFDVNGTYTNTSGGRQLVYLRTVVGRTGNSDAVFGYSGGFGQAS